MDNALEPDNREQSASNSGGSNGNQNDQTEETTGVASGLALEEDVGGIIAAGRRRRGGHIVVVDGAAHELAFALRRAAVRTLSLQPSRQLSTLRSGNRVTSFQSSTPSLARTFHQARIWRAENSAQDAVSESSGTTSEPLGQSEAVSKPATEQAYEKAEDVSEQVKEQASTLSERATEKKDDISEQAQEQASTLKEKAEDASEQAKDQASSITERATDAVSNLAQSATEAGAAAAQQAQSAVNQVSQAATNTASAFGTAASQPGQLGAQRRNDRDGDRPRRNSFAPDAVKQPSRILYVGNLFFEVTAPNLEAEFGRFGEVTNSRIVTDNRGLSKGFGYVEFSTQEAADQAARELDQKIFQGRRMAVQYHVPRDKREPRDGQQGGGMRNSSNREPAVPSKTLFIGNMSYQMSDRDLNDLFRSIKNVLDVRVAIDRRSGQPRGFAHADFIDVESATKAREILQKKEVYGRTLRVDYSGNSSSSKREV